MSGINSTTRQAQGLHHQCLDTPRRPPITRTAWTCAVQKTGLLTAGHKRVLLALAQRMRPDGTVSYPRRQLAVDLGYLPNADGEVNQRPVGKALQAGYEAGFLAQVGRGYEGHVAEYQAELPTRIGPQDRRPHNRRPVMVDEPERVAERATLLEPVDSRERVAGTSTLWGDSEGGRNGHPIRKTSSASRGEHVAVDRSGSGETARTASALPGTHPQLRHAVAVDRGEDHPSSSGSTRATHLRAVPDGGGGSHEDTADAQAQPAPDARVESQTDATCDAILRLAATVSDDLRVRRWRWRPKVAEALSAGWDSAALARRVTRDSWEGAQSPAAVLASRLGDALSAGPPEAAVSAAPTQARCDEHPWAGRRGDGECSGCYSDRQEAAV